MLAAAIRPTRSALERFVLPKPGEAPNTEAQRKGFFDLRFLGTAADGRQIRTKSGDRDPGYGSTAKMLGQAAACPRSTSIGRDGRRLLDTCHDFRRPTHSAADSALRINLQLVPIPQAVRP